MLLRNHRFLLEQYRLADIARKVVGVGRDPRPRPHVSIWIQC